MSMDELKQKLAPIHKRLNENLGEQERLLEEYKSLLEKSIELTDAWFASKKTNQSKGEKLG